MFGRWLKSYKYGNTRNYTRLPAPWPIKCKTQATGDGTEIIPASDISAGGVSIIVKDFLPVGSRLRLEIHVPPLNRSILAEGQVLRCQPVRQGNGFELGVRFEQIDPLDRIALNEAVERFYDPREQDRQHRGTWRRKLP